MTLISPAESLSLGPGAGPAVWAEMRIHDLRHSFASLLVTDGRSLNEVLSILGSRDPKVVMRYAHLSVWTLEATANDWSVLVPKAA
jgi:site-specific recombinase XerD